MKRKFDELLRIARRIKDKYWHRLTHCVLTDAEIESMTENRWRAHAIQFLCARVKRDLDDGRPFIKLLDNSKIDAIINETETGRALLGTHASSRGGRPTIRNHIPKEKLADAAALLESMLNELKLPPKWDHITPSPPKRRKKAPAALPVEQEHPTALPVEQEPPTALPVEQEPPTALPVEQEPPTALPAEHDPPTALPAEDKPPTEDKTPPRVKPLLPAVVKKLERMSLDACGLVESARLKEVDGADRRRHERTKKTAADLAAFAESMSRAYENGRGYVRIPKGSAVEKILRFDEDGRRISAYWFRAASRDGFNGCIMREHFADAADFFTITINSLGNEPNERSLLHA